ncbi:hypothetical protein [Yinghuangia sp. YIM S09857]|uniref:hypothetical protein n=1 Tax=Yinghuangia sp. YIM S09857 TaxID=3436929 RepID=UPI003F53686D
MTRSRLGLLLGNVTRIAAAVVIAASMVLVIWVKHPQEASSAEFLAGVSDGTITSVGYDVDGSQTVHVRWRASDTAWREAVYAHEGPRTETSEPWDPVAELRADLRARAPGADPVDLGTYPSMHTETAIDRLLVVTDVLYLPWDRLKWTVVALGAALICVMVARTPSYYGRPIQWIVLSLATGFGFLAYLWLEAPGRRAAAARAAASRMRLDPAALGCVTLAAAFVLLGI